MDGSERTRVFLAGVPMAGVYVARSAERDAESLKRNEADSESVDVGESFPRPNSPAILVSVPRSGVSGSLLNCLVEVANGEDVKRWSGEAI